MTANPDTWRALHTCGQEFEITRAHALPGLIGHLIRALPNGRDQEYKPRQSCPKCFGLISILMQHDAYDQIGRYRDTLPKKRPQTPLF